jgi:hypothetical protein
MSFSRIFRVLFLLSFGGLILAICCAFAQDAKLAQEAATTQERTPPSEPSNPKQIIPPPGIPTLKTTTRMVIVDVLALDGEDRPVEGLTIDDFRVFEKVGKSGNLPQAIASFRAVEPAYGPAGLSETLRLPSRSHCWVDAVPSHYELAYYLSRESLEDGVHYISIKARHGARLIYRGSYIMTGIGAPTPPPAEMPTAEKTPDPALMSAACGQSPVWAARLHAAYPFTSGRPNLLDYFLALDTGQFTFLHQAKDQYQLGVDYAVCATDAARNRLYFAQDSLDGVTTKEDYETVNRRGFPFFVEVWGRLRVAAIDSPPSDLF